MDTANNHNGCNGGNWADNEPFIVARKKNACWCRESTGACYTYKTSIFPSN